MSRHIPDFRISAFILILCIGLFTPAKAQNLCSTQEHHIDLLENDLDYQAAWLNTMAESGRSTDSEQVFQIPLVVHVVHLGESVGSGSNISNNQINLAINKLNRNFQYAQGLDIGIRFCLASRDPNGLPTNGIVRVDGRSVLNYESLGLESSQGPGADETAIKDLSRWPNTSYYNIWVVHTIVGGVAGYAYYPTTYINDGTTIESGYMSDLFTTLTHELGHAFNLRHVFEGDDGGSSCPINDDCTIQGDYICDTPPVKRDDCLFGSGCPSGGQPFNNSSLNFMSYCSFDNRFTPLQKIRLREAAMQYPRSLLAESDGCGPPDGPDVSLDIINFPVEGQSYTFCTGEITAEFSASNTGSVPIESFAVQYTYEDVLTSSVGLMTDLQPGEEASFELPAVDSDWLVGDNTLTIEVISVNKTSDVNATNDEVLTTFQVIDTCITTGVASNYFDQVSIYPNPVTSNYLMISGIPFHSSGIRYELRNSIGQLLNQGTIQFSDLSLDLNQYPKGSYVFRLITEEGLNFSRPLIKF